MIEFPYCVYPALKKVFCERQYTRRQLADAYGFEVDKGFYEAAKEKMLAPLFEKPEFEQIGMGDVV